MKRFLVVSGFLSILTVYLLVSTGAASSMRALSFDEMENLTGGQTTPCTYCTDYSWRVKGATLCETNGYTIVYDALCHPIGGDDCVNLDELVDCSTCIKEVKYKKNSAIDGGTSATVRSFCWAGTLYDWNCSGGVEIESTIIGRLTCP